MRDLTEKTRNLGETEEVSASTGQLVVQESRIVEYFQREADKPAAKAKPKPFLIPLPLSSTEKIPSHGRKWIDIEPQ